MKYQVVVVEKMISAIRKVDNDKTIYYLSFVKHYESGKTFTECIFITKVDYETLVAKYGEIEKK